MTKQTFTSKSNGDTLNASEWNDLTAYVNTVVDAVNDSNGGSIEGISVSSKGNLELSSAKHINIEPAYVDGGGEGTYGDIQLKPGDDITLESSHRATDKQGEITIKTTNGKGKNDPDKGTVKLELKVADLELSTEGKPGDDQNVMNVNVTTGNGKGYLKVRAQAIDLRCEANGGIALQPKGADNDGNENKIKFEHNGGDGKEFGTFNTEKTSIFTDEYRFNENGMVYAVTRETPTTQSYKDDGVTPKKIDYPTQNDDFKDIPVTEEGTACEWDSTNGWVVPQANTGEEILSCSWRDIILAVNYIKSQNPSLNWTQTTSNL